MLDNCSGELEHTELELDRGMSWATVEKWYNYFLAESNSNNNENENGAQKRHNGVAFFYRYANVGKRTGKTVVMVKYFSKLTSSNRKVFRPYSLSLSLSLLFFYIIISP